MTTRVSSALSSRTSRDAGEDLFVHELGDALDQFRAVHVVRDLGDDDLLAAALEFLDARLPAHAHRALPVWKYDLMPADPWMTQPVGKSGPFTYSINPSIVISGSSICAQTPSITSLRGYAAACWSPCRRRCRCRH